LERQQPVKIVAATMRAVLALLFLQGCAAAVPQGAERVIPAGLPPTSINYGFDPAAIQYDLLTSARARFGEDAVRRALAAETYLLAKHYHGRSPPPPPPGTPYRPLEPRMGMLVKEGGRWLAATPTGFGPAQAEAVAGIETILADRAFWAEPEWGQPGCTHSGASIFMLKAPRRDEIVRRGVCGPAPLGERLVFHAAAG
jgi:hypothetical protein